MSKLACVMGALTLLASPAVAQKANEDLTRNANERVICQKEESIGSRLAAKKICLTAKEWKERAALNREETERAQQRNTATPSGS